MSNLYAYALLAKLLKHQHVSPAQQAELLARCFIRLSQPDAPRTFACACCVGQECAFDLYLPGDSSDIHRAAMLVLYPEEFAYAQTIFLCFLSADVAFPALMPGNQALQWLSTFYQREQVAKEIAYLERELRFVHLCPDPSFSKELTRHLTMKKMALILSFALVDELFPVKEDVSGAHAPAVLPEMGA